jgi:hypothetical protein
MSCRDRLTADRQDLAGVEKTFTYDPSGNGNLLSQTGLGTHTYPLTTAARPHGVTSAGGKTFSCDANGNVIGDGTRTFAYDADNRLASVCGRDAHSSLHIESIPHRCESCRSSVNQSSVNQMDGRFRPPAREVPP